MPDLSQSTSWPGVPAVESCQGTISHGITASTFVLVTYPQTSEPAAAGDLVFFDGFRTAPLRDCKLSRITGRAGPDGTSYTLEILDRRWKWRADGVGFSTLSGRYNQTDPRGKLIPWTIRSPEELARLCLDAMGETGYVLDLPRGLTKADGANLDRYLRLGENFVQSFANPPVVWDVTPPAEALARLAEQFGCRVVFQPIRNRVLVVPLGKGQALPADVPAEMVAPSIDAPKVPVRVGVAGAPVRIQYRFFLEAVGKEWDGAYIPIDQLSYAPKVVGQVQITTLTYSGGASNPKVGVTITFTPPGGTEEVTIPFTITNPALTIEDKLAEIAALINDNPQLGPLVLAFAVGGSLELTGLTNGFAFSVSFYDPGDSSAPGYDVNLVQEGIPDGTGWDACPPPTFPAVRATDQLSYTQAQGLARESVFRCYRIRFIDVATKKAPIRLPWYGPLKRRQQIILQLTKVRQVVPQARIQGGVNNNNVFPGAAIPGGAGVLPEFYDGYSRDQAATVTGSVRKSLNSVLWLPIADEDIYNSPPMSRVCVPFEVDQAEQMIVFTDYVYKYFPIADTFNTLKQPSLILETACLVQDPDTSELVRWRETMELGGDAPPEWQIHEDLQVGVIANFDPQGRLVTIDFAERDDVASRARYYLAGMANKYQVKGGESRQMVGIHPIDPDGMIQQVSWSVGPAGPTTIASSNTEHSAVVLPYPARRRAENLSPNQSAALVNRVEQMLVDRYLPRQPKATR